MRLYFGVELSGATANDAVTERCGGSMFFIPPPVRRQSHVALVIEAFDDLGSSVPSTPAQRGVSGFARSGSTVLRWALTGGFLPLRRHCASA